MNIGVVIPTYNRADFLMRVLPSYLTSDLTREVIVVDDAGTDHTTNVIRQLIDQDHRLRHVRNEKNMGAPASRNRGASISTAAWILQSEDDLALGPNCLETLLSHAEETGADIIAGRRIWMRLGETEEQALARANTDRRPLFCERLMDHNSHAITSDDIETPLLDGTMLIRRELFDRIRYYEPYGGQSSWREESDFQISALELGYKLVFCPHAITFHYSRSSQSFGHNRVKGNLMYAYRVYRNNLTFLRRHSDFLSTNHHSSLLFGSPELSAVRYGIYRTVWLIAAEAVRYVRTRRHGGFAWE